MKPLVALVSVVAVFGVLDLTSTQVGAEPRVVGGITPDRRPEGLPAVSQSDFDAKAMKRALHGIAEPHPASIDKWLDDQGGWFTPFSRPGMTGRFDIRHWHEKPNG